MKIAVSELRPNPFRALDRYPLKPEKIEALVASIKHTSFWDNVLVRKAPDGKGYELAYGHHRLVALKKAKIDSIDVPVRPLTDTDMARIMAHENAQEWSYDAAVEHETVRAVVVAYGEGRIELGKPPSKNGQGVVRCAPYFSQELSARAESSHPYTAATLAEFLGWAQHKVEAALGALALVEKGAAEVDTFRDLTTKQAETLVTQTNRVLKERPGDTVLAKQIATRLKGGMRLATDGKAPRNVPKHEKAEVTIHTAREVTDRLLGKVKLQEKKAADPGPDINAFADSLSKVFTDARTSNIDKLKEVVKHREHLKHHSKKSLVATLRATAKFADDFADKLEA